MTSGAHALVLGLSFFSAHPSAIPESRVRKFPSYRSYGVAPVSRRLTRVSSAAAEEEIPEERKPDITIIGLGPSRPGAITEEALDALKSSDKFFARTASHPSLERFRGTGREPTTFDYIYDSEDEFSRVYERIAETIVEEASKGSSIAYGVPGDPYVAEASVGHICRLAQAKGLDVRIVSGVSFIEPVMAAVEADVLEPKLLVLDALDIMGKSYCPVQPATPLLVTQVYRKEVASEVKLVLSTLIDDEDFVAMVHDAGGEDEAVEWVRLCEIDHDPMKRIGLRTAVYVPGKQDDEMEMTSFEDVMEAAFFRALEAEGAIEEELRSGPTVIEGSDFVEGLGIEEKVVEQTEDPSNTLWSTEDDDEDWGPGFEEVNAYGVAASSAALLDCLATTGRADDEKGMIAEEDRLAEAFADTFAELSVAIAQAKEAGLIGELRVADILACARAKILEPYDDGEE